MTGHRGWTMIEVLVVLALIGIAAGMAATAGFGTRAHVDAAIDLARRITAARWQAVVTGRDDACLPRDLPVGAHEAVRVAWPARGLAFTADGLPRGCDGSGVGNATIVLEHRGRRAAVVVSSFGRVRWEQR